MGRHPCIICDDLGTYEHDGARYVCDCGPGQRFKAHLSSICQQPYASTPENTSSPRSAMNTEATTPDMAPSHSDPNTTVANHFIPTAPVGGFHYG